MALKRLVEGCITCKYVDTCNHKEMEMFGYLELQLDSKDYYSRPSKSTIDRIMLPIIEDLASNMHSEKYSVQQIKDILYNCTVMEWTNGKE